MSKIRHFYRIEHKETKIGPFRSVFGFYPFFYLFTEETGLEMCSSNKNCPTPREEDIEESLWCNSDARYGFTSISKVRKWFGRNKKKFDCFEKYNFVLKKYSVDSGNIFVSPTQAIVMLHDLTEWEELDFSVIYAKA